MPRKELRPEDVTVLIDSREQTPLDLSPLKTEPGSLPTGDYAIKGLEHIACVERKSLQDLVGSLTAGRERFDREMQRILAYPSRLVIVEGSLSNIVLKQYRANVEPNSIVGSILGYMAKGIPILFAGTHEDCGRMVARFLFIVARRRWEEAQALCESLKIAT